MLLREAELATLYLTQPLTISSETICSYLTACVVTKIMPIDLELDVVIQVHKLVGHGMFHVRLVREIALAEYHCTRVVVKAA